MAWAVWEGGGISYWRIYRKVWVRWGWGVIILRNLKGRKEIRYVFKFFKIKYSKIIVGGG